MKSQIICKSRHVTQKSMGLMGYCFISDTDGFRHNFFLRILIKEKMSMGGSFENRIKIPMMIVDRVRQAVGRDYMLDMRISGEEHIEGGMEIDEVAEL